MLNQHERQRAMILIERLAPREMSLDQFDFAYEELFSDPPTDPAVRAIYETVWFALDTMPARAVRQAIGWNSVIVCLKRCYLFLQSNVAYETASPRPVVVPCWRKSKADCEGNDLWPFRSLKELRAAETSFRPLG